MENIPIQQKWSKSRNFQTLIRLSSSGHIRSGRSQVARNWTFSRQEFSVRGWAKVNKNLIKIKNTQGQRGNVLHVDSQSTSKLGQVWELIDLRAVIKRWWEKGQDVKPRRCSWDLMRRADVKYGRLSINFVTI